MGTIDTPALDTLWNQLSGFICKLHSAPDDEKSKIVEFLKSTVSQLEAKQSSTTTISQNVDCDSDRPVSTNYAATFSSDVKPSETQLIDPHLCETAANEAPSPMRSSFVSAYESSDLFLKDIFNSAFSDQAVVSSLFEPESSRGTLIPDATTTASEVHSIEPDPTEEDAPTKQVSLQSSLARRLKPKEPIVLSCPICHCTFTNWSAMEHHLYTGHTTSLAPVCWRCQGVFDNHAALLAHECFDWGRVHLPCQGANNRGTSGLTGRARALLRRGMQLGFPENGVFLRRRCGLCFKSVRVFRSSNEFREHKKTIHASCKRSTDGLDPLHRVSRGRRVRKSQHQSNDPDVRDPTELLHPKSEDALQTCVRRIFERFCRMHSGKLGLSTVDRPTSAYVGTAGSSVQQCGASASAHFAGPSNFASSTEPTATTMKIAHSGNVNERSSNDSVSPQRSSLPLAEAIFQEAIHTTHNVNKLATDARELQMRRGRTIRAMLWRRKRKIQLRRIRNCSCRNSEPATSHSVNGPRKSATSRRRYVCRCCFTEFRVASRLRAHHLFQHGNIPASLGGLSPRPGERGGMRSLRQEGRMTRSRTKAPRVSQHSSNECGEMEQPRMGHLDTTANQLKPMIRFPNPLTTESDEVTQLMSPTSSTVESTSASNGSTLARRRSRGSRLGKNKHNHDDNMSIAQSSSTASGPPFICSSCNRQYLTVHTLRRHQSQSHGGQYRLYCGYCDYRTNERTAYDEHLARHFHVRQFACTFCNARFIVERELKDHMAFKHTDERNYQCGVCGMTFKTAGTLSRHRKIHGERKLHECNLCLTKFTRLSNLKRHMSNAHMRRNGQLSCTARNRARCGRTVSAQSLTAADSNQRSMTWTDEDFGPERGTAVTATSRSQTGIDSSELQSPSPKQQLPTATQSSETMVTNMAEPDASSRTTLTLHMDSNDVCTLLDGQLDVGCQNTTAQVNIDNACGSTDEPTSLGPVYVVDLTELGTSEGLLRSTNGAAETHLLNEDNVDMDRIESDSGDHFGSHEQSQVMAYTMTTPTPTASTTITISSDSLAVPGSSSTSTEHVTESISWVNPRGCPQSGLCYLLTRIDSPSQFLCSDSESRAGNGVVTQDFQKCNDESPPMGTIPVVISSAGDGGTSMRHESIQLICSYPSSPMLLDKTTGASGIWRPVEPLEVDYTGVGQSAVTSSHGMEPNLAIDHHHHHHSHQQQQLLLTSVRPFDASPTHDTAPQKPAQSSFNHSEFYAFESNLLLNSEGAGTCGLSQSPRFPSPVSGATSPRTMLYPTSPVQSHLSGYGFPVSHPVENDGAASESISLSATTGATTVVSSTKSTVRMSLTADDPTLPVQFSSHANQSYTEQGVTSAPSTSSHFVSQFLPPIWCYPTVNTTSFLNGQVPHTSPLHEFPLDGVDQCSNFSVGYLIGQNRAACSVDQQQLGHYTLSPESSVTSPTTATYFEFDGTMS